MAKDTPNLSFNWSTPVAIPIGDPPIAHDDSTPSVKEQARQNGWASEYYNFGLGERDGIEHFNPAIVERKDGLWLLVRRSEPHPLGFQFGQNDVWAFMLDETGKVPKMGKRLRWMNHEASQHFEDPRGFYHPRINQTLIGACTFVWYPNQPWTGAHQCFGAFDENWVCQKMDYPRIGGNPGVMKRIEKHENYEKNWLFFLHNDRLHLLYKAHPWLVVEFGTTWNDSTDWKLEEGAKWAYGDIRGGTTPVRVGDYYFTFHHSSLAWKARYRRYFAGCLAFEAKPPFKPVMITPEPLLRGSQNDEWTQRKPLVVFPCGSLYRKGKWLVTLGVNDLKAAWMELSHESLLARMKPIGDHTPIFHETGLSDGERQAEARILSVVPVPDEPTAHKNDTEKGGAREGTHEAHHGGESDQLPATNSRGGTQKVSKGGDAKCAATAEETTRSVTTIGVHLTKQPSNAAPTFDPNSAASQTRQDGLEYGSTLSKNPLTTLEKRRAAAAKARAALAAKRLVSKSINEAWNGVKDDYVDLGQFLSKPKRRRKRRKSATKEAKLKALAEHESKKTLQST